MPSPGPTTTALHLAVGLQEGAGPPSAGRCRRTASVGQGATGVARAGPGGPCPAPAAMAPRVHSTAAPSMPAEPAATPTALRPLVDVAGPARQPARRRRRPRPGRPGASGNADPDVGHLHARRQSRAPSPWSRPGFRAAKVTVRSARTASPGGRAASRRRPPRGCRWPAPRRRRARRGVVGAPEPGAVGGVDDEVAGGSPRAGRGASAASTTLHPCAPPRPAPSRHPPVGAVVALAGHHDHPAGRRHRRACAGRRGPPPCRPGPPGSRA